MTELLLAALLPAKRRSKLLLASSGLNAALLGVLTEYELGLLGVVPMRVHLALDAVFAATFAGATTFLDETPVVRSVFGALAGTGAAATALTDPDRR